MTNEQHNFPVVKTIDGQFLPQKKIVDSTVAGTVVTYEGWCPKGSKTSDAVWKIRRTTQVTSGSIVTTTYEWANGKPDFENIWDNYATVGYGF